MLNQPLVILLACVIEREVRQAHIAGYNPAKRINTFNNSADLQKAAFLI